MRVIGIDPGLSATGYGIVESTGINTYAPVAYGTIRTSSKKDIASRLFSIYENLQSVTETYSPDAAGIESVFIGKDPKNHLHIGEARGAIFVALKKHGIDVYEFSPLQVKKAITGYGAAEKAQVCFMVSRLLGIRSAVNEHVADALAIALSALNQHTLEQRYGQHDRITAR
ncbi:crossover junction endodeoxyribonuclease RuvC [Syntrophorhabdus aromaticivorans]|uniref:Crossover junction endodeoxyribonuclease RuvC n=1 Tax=Syntrophorhabdus aromaticivorans TaxID=328301 RepID=A0A351U4U6_9BACT|nr:crossover junction endodeoxyribonuclease RuvC [Syntrophorhabdus aromaticivorans]NLW34218.1 crossover junction endodeoxyribonuclease RuvC [Syntrophorhabdus aromaticivorans]HBA54977.1 crossover junction endodeoxyribonuclease RuvC [Syntrophorhabdus aromaticivorans]